jgi:hypothetical protein
MATDTRKQALLETMEFVYDSATQKKHYIHPMISKDIEKVTELFSKINDEYIILNYPHSKVDDAGNLVLTEDEEEIEDVEAFDAMKEILEIALEEPWESIDAWISIRQIEEVLAMFRGLSGLLKKKRELEKQILNSTSSVPA